MVRIKGSFTYKTDIGRVRETNEDQALALLNASGDVLLVVCDGMGGHNRGDYASQLAVDMLGEAFRNISGFLNAQVAKFWLARIIRKINNKIYDTAFSNHDYEDMGTTLCAVLIRKNKIIVANIGDSRAYIDSGEELVQLTQDQTFVDYLYRTGKITAEEKKTHPQRHILMNALGIFATASIDVHIKNHTSEAIFICSDGIYNNITEKEIHAILSSDDRVEQKVDTVMLVANKNGGSDNMAIAYWECKK